MLSLWNQDITAFDTLRMARNPGIAPPPPPPAPCGSFKTNASCPLPPRCAFSASGACEVPPFPPPGWRAVPGHNGSFVQVQTARTGVKK